jgi:hypothetical protein
LSVNTDVQTTTYEECDPFIDEGGKTVYKQRKTIVTGESGTVYSTSLCENYQVLAEIKIKQGDCTYIFDMAANNATATEQWYYVDPSTGDEAMVGGCRESGLVFPIYNRCDQILCPDYFDEANSLVFPQCSKGIMVGETWFPAPSECQPQDGVSYAVDWEYVRDVNGTIVTQDDFTNGVSYPKIRKFYEHPEKGKTYLTEAMTSATESYPHRHDTAACGWIMNDTELKAQQLSNTYIETSEGVKELQECAARTAPVPYAFVGIKDHDAFYENIDTGSQQTGYTKVWHEFVPPSGLTRLIFTLVGAGQQGSGSATPYNSYYPSHADLRRGGKSSVGLRDVEVVIEDGETIPIYVGRPGISGYGYPLREGTGSQVGNDSSSFEPLITGYANFRTGGATPGPDGSVAGGCGAQGSLWNLGTREYPALGWGGGGNGYSSAYSSSGSRGQAGVVYMQYKSMKYLRPDGTYYDLPYNGD